MHDHAGIFIEHWSADFGDGASPDEVALPHAWRQEVSLDFEGPVVYRTSPEVPERSSKLVFHGVSYAADVRINGAQVTSHRGIWDAFEVPLKGHEGKRIEIEVSVVKNGGKTYPVNEVASGFLPFVYHTFGGIYGKVQIVDEAYSLSEPPPSQNRASVLGTRIYVDAKPFYVRGLLHWGWYPECGHTNPPTETIRREVKAAKALGFNLVKFCLWVPSHQYLEILREEGMEAWFELPLWDPTPDTTRQDQIAHEFEQIVRQYRHHDNIILWTVGCELSTSTTPDFRQRMTQVVKNLTGSPLVKDNSGGAEMYGGDLREFGDFYDFHPYCDTPYYPSVLDSLLPGPRPEMPTLLGEFNDIDVHRDLPRLAREFPYWSSTLSELNSQGVRWQHDLPGVLAHNRFAENPGGCNHSKLMESSRKKALFMRKAVQEAVRSRSEIGGYVITGWRDTPISTAGFFDDWDKARFSPNEVANWNDSACLFQIPSRRPPWINGGNRPGFVDPMNQFVGQLFWSIGIHSETQMRGGLSWMVTCSDGRVAAQGACAWKDVAPLTATLVGQIAWDCQQAGHYELTVEFGSCSNKWPIWVIDRFEDDDRSIWSTQDPYNLLGFQSDSGDLTLSVGSRIVLKPGIVVLTGPETIAKPFWREAAYEFRNNDFWATVPFAERWESLIAISPDRFIDGAWLESLGLEYEVLINRIDVRTYAEDPVLVRIGDALVTTIRPFGGLGNQPFGVPKNAAGVEFLRCAAQYLKGGADAQ